MVVAVHVQVGGNPQRLLDLILRLLPPPLMTGGLLTAKRCAVSTERDGPDTSKTLRQDGAPP